MNKRLIILISFITLTLILFISTIQFNKSISDIHDFKKLILKENYLIHDTTKEYNDPLVKESFIAYNNDYQIEFIIFNNEEDCENAFKINILSLMQNDNIDENIKKFKRYTLYTYINSTNYVYIRKEKDTLLYINTNVEYKESIENLINKLI